MAQLGSMTPSGGGEFTRRRKRALLIFGVVAVVLALLVATAHITRAGTVTVPVTFGSAQAPLSEGLHFTAPWPITVTSDMSVQTQNYTMTAADIPGTDDPVLVLGLDGASATVQATLLYNLEPARASDVFRDVGTDFDVKLVQPTARACIRSEFANYNMVDAATGALDDVTGKVRTCISDKIEPVGIRLQDLQIREVSLGDQVQNAINAKVSADQDIARRAFELEQARLLAEITKVNAGATADAQQILACGATVSDTERDGKPVQVVIPNPPEQCNPAQLSDQVLQYNYIQMLGQVLKSDGNTIILGGDSSAGAGGVSPVINVGPTTTAAP